MCPQKIYIDESNAYDDAIGLNATVLARNAMTTASQRLHGYINPSGDEVPGWLRNQLADPDLKSTGAFAVGFVGDDRNEVALLFVLEDEQTIALVSMTREVAEELVEAVIYNLDAERPHA